MDDLGSWRGNTDRLEKLGYHHISSFSLVFHSYVLDLRNYSKVLGTVLFLISGWLTFRYCSFLVYITLACVDCGHDVLFDQHGINFAEDKVNVALVVTDLLGYRIIWQFEYQENQRTAIQMDLCARQIFFSCITASQLPAKSKRNPKSGSDLYTGVPTPQQTSKSYESPVLGSSRGHIPYCSLQYDAPPDRR